MDAGQPAPPARRDIIPTNPTLDICNAIAFAFFVQEGESPKKGAYKRRKTDPSKRKINGWDWKDVIQQCKAFEAGRGNTPKTWREKADEGWAARQARERKERL